MNAKEQKEHDAKIAECYVKYPDADNGFQMGYNMAARHIAEAIRCQTESEFHFAAAATRLGAGISTEDAIKGLKQLKIDVNDEAISEILTVTGDTYLARDTRVKELRFENDGRLHLNGYKLTIDNMKPEDWLRVDSTVKNVTAETSSPKPPVDQKP